MLIILNYKSIEIIIFLNYFNVDLIGDFVVTVRNFSFFFTTMKSYLGIVFVSNEPRNVRLNLDRVNIYLRIDYVQWVDHHHPNVYDVDNNVMKIVI